MSEEPELIKEKHTYKAKNISIPIAIFQKFTNGEISALEMILLQMIDHLVDCKGEGCWASNTYLGKQIRKSKSQVSRMIGRLKDVGLLLEVGTKKIGHQDFRVLETPWSRIGEKGTEQSSTIRRNAEGTIRKSAYSTLRKNAEQIYMSRNNKRENCRPPLRGFDDAFLFDKADSNKQSVGNCSFLQELSSLSEHIYSKVKSRLIQKRWNKSKWIDDLASLHEYIQSASGKNSKLAFKVMEEEIKYHLLHLSDEYQPEALAPDGILSKWNKICRANSIRRDNEGDEVRHPMTWKDDAKPKKKGKSVLCVYYDPKGNLLETKLNSDEDYQ